MTQKKNYVFSDFLAISSERWKEKIIQELNASPEVLHWKTPPLSLEPFYTSQDVKNLSYLENFHSHLALKAPRHWYTREHVLTGPGSPSNASAKLALEGGADAIHFDLSNRKDPYPKEELFLLIKELPLTFCPLHFTTSGSLHFLAEWISNVSPSIKGSLLSNSLRDSLEQKKFQDALVKDMVLAIAALQKAPAYKGLVIDATLFHEKNCNPVQEVAYALTLTLDLIDKLTEKGIHIKDVLRNIEFSFSVSKNYFIEIAKLRALRILWKKIAEACAPDFESLSTPVHCTTSRHTFSKEDVNQNILYNTAEAMAAVLGGCDSLTIYPFDLQSGNVFSSRISRNISMLLKEESYFDKVVDPGAGSYYIDKITDQLIDRSWELITDIEKRGGFIKIWEKGDLS